MFNKPKPKRYGHKANVIKLGSDRYAVLKYLLPPKYYEFGIAKDMSRQLIVRKQCYVQVTGQEIMDDIQDFITPHVLDNYDFPMNGDVYPEYEDKSPFPAQIHTARWLIGGKGQGQEINKGRGHNLFSSMRTGKTLSALWAMDAGLRLGLFNKVLIVSPKVLMRTTWAAELERHLMHIKYTLKEGVRRDRVTDTPIDIIGIDALTVIIKKNLIQRFTLIIIDEASGYKSTMSQRYKIFRKWFDDTHRELGTRLWMLTGTPVSQDPVNAFAFAQLVSPNLAPRNLTSFRGMTQYKNWDGSYTNKNNAAETCMQVLQPSLRFQLNDIIEIEDCCLEYITVEKSPKQAKMFKAMATEFLIDMKTTGHDKPLTASTAAAKANKLLQILSGCVYDENREVIYTEATHKFGALCEIIDQLPEHQGIVIFAEFTHTINMLRDYLKPIYKTVEVIDGSVGVKDEEDHRAAINRRFLQNKTKVLILQPITGAFGLDLSSTNIMVYFTPSYRAELVRQSYDRIRNFASASKGFTKFTVFHLLCDNIEKLIYQGIAEKLLTENQIFELIRMSLKEEFEI